MRRLNRALRGLRASIVAGAVVGSTLGVIAACASLPGGPEGEAAGYAAELEACTLRATSLAESIACENRARAAHGRPLRPMPADGGDAS